MVSLIRGVLYTACMCRDSIALRYFISVCDIKEYAAGAQLWIMRSDVKRRVACTTHMSYARRRPLFDCCMNLNRWHCSRFAWHIFHSIRTHVCISTQCWSWPIWVSSARLQLPRNTRCTSKAFNISRTNLTIVIRVRFMFLSRETYFRKQHFNRYWSIEPHYDYNTKVSLVK